MNVVIHFWLNSGKFRELGSQKVWENQETFLKKLGRNPEEVSHSFAEFEVLKVQKIPEARGGGEGGWFWKVYLSKPPLLGFFLVKPILRKGGRDCLACPPTVYQDHGYLAWFSPDLLYSYLSEKYTNWVILPISVNFTN